MRRTTRSERKENAVRFYNGLKEFKKVSLIVERTESKANPNIQPCRFVSVCSDTGYGVPRVIAASNLGIQGCFVELFSSIGVAAERQTAYQNAKFDEWVMTNFGFSITYNDGLVMIFEAVC